MSSARSLAPLLMIAGCCAIARADDLANFPAIYRRAAPAIEKAYSELLIQGTCVQFGQDDRVTLRDDVMLCVDGDNYSKTTCACIDAGADYPAGTISVEMGATDLSFNASKLPMQAGYKFSQYGKTDSQKRRDYRQLRLPAATGPYCVQGMRLADLLNSPIWACQSAEPATVEGKPAIKVTFTHPGKNQRVRARSIEIVLDPKDWCLIDYTIDFGPTQNRGHLDYYDADTFPRRVKTAETWTQHAGHTERLNRTRTETTSYQFTKPPPQMFTLQGLGVNSLPPVEMMK